MSDKIVYTTDDSFDSDVLQADMPVLVDYWAEWCGPCKTIAPILDDVTGEYSGKLKVCKLNIDENPDAPTGFGIHSIPAVLLFKDGKVVESSLVSHGGSCASARTACGAAALMRQADTAMYLAKRRGRNRAEFFTDEMNQTVMRRLALESGMRTAADDGSLLVQYQPIFDIRRLKVVGAEALVRWNHAPAGPVDAATIVAVY